MKIFYGVFIRHYSITDRYCVENGVRVESRRYDRYLLLRNRMTISNLSEGNNLITMMAECCDPKYLLDAGSELAVAMRTLHTYRHYPLSSEERNRYNRELNLKKGDVMIINAKEEEFGQYIRVNDPKTLIDGDGTLDPDGDRISLYHWGLFVHPMEQEHILEYLYFELSLLSNCIDEYKDEILGEESDILLKKTTFCANCDSDETKLLMCGACKVIFYCSKVS